MVSISDATPGAAIYYTIDGSTPTSGSAAYTAPITLSGGGIDTTVTLRAAAVKVGMEDSAISTADYSIVYPAMRAQWAQTVIAFPGATGFSSLAIDAAHAIYAAGYANSPSVFAFGNDVTASCTGMGDNPLLVKYDTTGAATWVATTTAGSTDCAIKSVAVSAEGDVYVVGSIAGADTHTFGPGFSALIVKYDASGAAKWARTPMSSGNNTAFSCVAVDASGDV